MELPVKSSYIRRKDMDSVLNCLISDRIDSGTYTNRFIKQAKERFNFDFGIALRSPITALTTCFSCLNLEPGSPIGLSALSPAWVYKAIVSNAYTPVWLDVDLSNASLTKNVIFNAPAIKALFLAEPWGIMPQADDLVELEIPVIEDATFSIGAIQGGKKAGFLGNFSIIGLEHSCSINGGAGALLFTPSKKDSALLRNAAEKLVEEEKMSDLNASLALSQIKDFDKFLNKRRELHELYVQSLLRSHKKVLSENFDCQPSNFGCVIIFDGPLQDIRSYAKKKEIQTIMAFEDSCIAHSLVPERLCPNALSLLNRALAFPLNQKIGRTNAQKIAKLLASLP